MKRSTVVALTLIGVPFAAGAALYELRGRSDMRRNFYADRAACERDYSPKQCDATTAPHSSGLGYVHGWYGPLYAADRAGAAARSDAGPGRVGSATSVATVSTRGGFGGIAGAASASS